MSYQDKNAIPVLEKVEAYIEKLENKLKSDKELYGHAFSRKNYMLRIQEVYRELSIFDWWDECLSISQLKDMRKFLKEAVKLGYKGYVCFKVGASGCANGMWAAEKETTDGFSPNCRTLYKSFTPDYNEWCVTLTEDARGDFSPSFKTIKELEAYIKENNLELKEDYIVMTL